MKLCFSTLGCPKWSFEEVIDFAVKHGYQGLEIRGVDGEMFPDKIARFQLGRQQETKKLIADAGLKMHVFGTSVKFHEADKREENIEQGKKAIDVCAAMGIPYIRIFGDQIGDADEKTIIDQVISGSKELCEYAKGTGVEVLLEVHGQFNVLERVLAVCEGVAMDNFGLVWDVAHSDKTYGDDYKVFYDGIKPYIRHIHIKDHKHVDGGFDLCRLGEGDIPILPIVRMLIDDGYDGRFSLEWEKLWHPELAEPEVAFVDYLELMKKA